MLRLVALALALAFFSLVSGDAQAQKKVRVAYPSSADMGDIPSLLAWEQLKKQGIEIVPQFFPKTDLAVQAPRERLVSQGYLARRPAHDHGRHPFGHGARCSRHGNQRNDPRRSRFRRNADDLRGFVQFSGAFCHDLVDRAARGSTAGVDSVCGSAPDPLADNVTGQVAKR